MAGKNAPLGFRPERGKYTVKSDGYVLGRIKQVQKVASEIRKLGDDLSANHQTNTNTIDHMVNLFTGAHELGIPDGKRYVNFDAKSAKPADIIFRILGMLMAQPQPQYISPAGSDKDKVRNDRIEAHLSALNPWLFRKYQTRFDIQNRFWQLLAGRSYIQQSFLPNYWDKTLRGRTPKEKVSPDDDARTIGAKNSMYNARVAGYKGYMGPPFFKECIDPRIVHPIMTPMGPDGWVKIYKVERFEMDAAFERVGRRVELDRDNKVLDVHDLSKKPGLELPVQADSAQDNSNVDYYEYLDDTYVYYVVGDTVAHRYRHDGGIKMLPAYGLQTGFKEISLAAMGVLWPVRNELPQFDFMRTLWVQKAYLDVFPQLFAQLAGDENPLTDEKGAPTTWNIEPMTVKQVRGQLVNALKDAQSGMDFRAAVEMFAGDIDLATISGLARGVAGAQQPGYAINQLSQAMRTNWKPIIESADLQESSSYEHYLWTIKNRVGESVTIFGQQESSETGRLSGDYFPLDPDDIEDFFRVEAHLDPDLPIDAQGTMMSYAKLHQEGMVTFEDFVRLGLKKSSPVAYKEKVIADVAERAFLPKALEDAMALGRVELTNDIIKERGLDKLNSIGNMDIAALKAARAKQPLPPDAAAGGGGGVELPAGHPGTPGPGPQVAEGTAGGVPLSVGVTGSNPNDPAPGPRG